MSADIDTDSDNNGAIVHASDDPIENDADKLDRIVGLNKDDDNSNGTPDMNDSGPVAGENDLAEVDILSTGVSPTATGQLTGTLRASAGIKVWADPNRSQLIVAQAGIVTWDLFTRSVPTTVYVEGVIIGEATLMWSLSIGSPQTDIVKFTVVDVDLLASTSNEMTEETPGTPVLLNDDWDCQLKYPANAVGDHRELEPIWDRDYTGGRVAGEDDLMRVLLSVGPSDLPGNGTLTITSGATNVRLWPSASKGTSGELIVLPPEGRSYAIASLPSELYVEGIALGRTVMTLEYTVGSITVKDTLNIDVVMLRESQSGQRRVINSYNSDISFIVQSDHALSSQYICYWDLDGDGVHDSGVWESDTDTDAVVKYSSAASCAGNIQLPTTAANRRKTYDVSVVLAAPGFSGGLLIRKTIRVALGTYEGTAVATTEAGRRAEVPTLAAPPAGFTDTPASGDYSQSYFESNYGVATTPPPCNAINAGNRLQYSTNTNAFGLTPFNGMGAGRHVYVVMVLEAAYNAGFKREDLQSVALHECRHASQHISVAAGGNNWRAVDDYYTQASGYANLREADAECVELNANGSWLYLHDDSWFRNKYTSALTDYGNMTAGDGKNAAKAILQSIYEDIPFLEMKRNDYDWSVRAPQ